MVTPTHILFSSTIYLTGSALAGHPISIIEFALCVIFSVFPADLDTPTSVLGRKVKPVSRYIQREFKHRGLTHSIWVHAILITATNFVTNNAGMTWAVGIGCLSHSFLDATTKQGVYLLWPIPFKFVIPCKQAHRFTVLSKAEAGVSILFFLTCLFTLPFVTVKSYEFSGMVGTVQSLMTNAKSERKKYDLNRGKVEWYLSLTGSKNEDFSPVIGDYYIIGGHGASGFLIEVEGKAMSACEGSRCDILIKSCQAKKGTTSEQFKIYHIKHKALITTDLFHTELSDFIGEMRYYLTEGQLHHAQDTLGAGKLIKIKFDRLNHIPHSGYLSEIDLKLQLRIATHNQFPRFPNTLFQDKGVEVTIDPLLNKWLPDFLKDN